ncbi:ferric reductase like transmembrane component [Xylariales sp. AK1849]|nr:ferric reductase like transmembrane component [Xylariales sp. AK1849]
MSWPYQFVDLSKVEKHNRRLSLDRYGALAQLSTLLPVVVILLIRLIGWGSKRISASDVAYNAVPGSPAAKRRRDTLTGLWRQTARKVAWWLGDDVRFAGQIWGRRSHFLFGIGWALWLLVLCVVGTGQDYFHLTKRFGIIAASQFPIQYILALKYINPVAYAFGSSHEEINPWHRVLGRIIYFLLILHGTFYLNYWAQIGALARRIASPVAIIGIGALSAMTLMNTSALLVVRKYSYRVFFVTHLLVALALPPAIFFHVHHARIYMIEALVVFIVDMAVRKMTTVTAEATLELIPDTDLMKIALKVPQQTATHFRDSPGCHIYMNVPVASRPSSNPLSMSYLAFEFMFNPFTVASVNGGTRELILVARQCKGPMTRALAGFAGSRSKVPLSIEGPYGVARRFPSLVGPKIDRILLFAGGVGSTFILPIYQYIIGENPAAHVDMIWAVREAGEATWPASGMEKSILDNDRIQLFLTGNIFDSDNGAGSSSGASGGVEMGQMQKDHKRKKYTLDHNRKRPDLKKIVDEAFRQGQEDCVAVLVCGPDNMARELRGYVGDWVRKGRQVWWHNESFSW